MMYAKKQLAWAIKKLHAPMYISWDEQVFPLQFNNFRNGPCQQSIWTGTPIFSSQLFLKHTVNERTMNQLSCPSQQHLSLVMFLPLQSGQIFIYCAGYWYRFAFSFFTILFTPIWCLRPTYVLFQSDKQIVNLGHFLCFINHVAPAPAGYKLL